MSFEQMVRVPKERVGVIIGRSGEEKKELEEFLKVKLAVDSETGEVMVKAEAAYGLGVIGLNKDNEVVQALAFAYNREDPTRPDNNFGYALCLAVEKIAKKTGGISEPRAYQMLVRIAQGNYLRTVKTKALQVLEELKAAH